MVCGGGLGGLRVFLGGVGACSVMQAPTKCHFLYLEIAWQEVPGRVFAVFNKAVQQTGAGSCLPPGVGCLVTPSLLPWGV